jgi:hypothetical protein
MADKSIWKRLWALQPDTFSLAQQSAILVTAFAALIAVGLPITVFGQRSRLADFMEVSAMIASVEERCDLFAKSESSFNPSGYDFIRTTSCPEANVFLASNAEEEWQIERKTLLSLDYVASGVPQTVTLDSRRFDMADVVPGGTVVLYINPNQLDEVETASTSRSLILTTILALASAAIAALGWIVFRMLTPELAEAGEDTDDQDSSIE